MRKTNREGPGRRMLFCITTRGLTGSKRNNKGLQGNSGIHRLSRCLDGSGLFGNCFGVQFPSLQSFVVPLTAGKPALRYAKQHTPSRPLPVRLPQSWAHPAGGSESRYFVDWMGGDEWRGCIRTRGFCLLIYCFDFD